MPLTMLTKTEGIVLGTFSYSDTYSIARVYTRDFERSLIFCRLGAGGARLAIVFPSSSPLEVEQFRCARSNG